MWDDLCRGASAAVVLVDTRRLDVSFPAVNYFENDSDVPFVVAVNLFDGRQTHPLDQVRDALGVADTVPLVTVDARDRRSAIHALLAGLTTRWRRRRGHRSLNPPAAQRRLAVEALPLTQGVFPVRKNSHRRRRPGRTAAGAEPAG